MDGALASVLPLLAWRALATPELNKAVVLFIAFGLLSALTWARLDAPDIALVEAAVGTGLTGALLMAAFEWVPAKRRAPQPLASLERSVPWLAASAVTAGVASALWVLPDPSRGLTDEVLGALSQSGVTHPVTAVLLNYRAYDTLLEIAVLLAAVLGVQTQRRRGGLTGVARVDGPMLPALVRKLVPGVVLVAGYLLWLGSRAPGGAFQAGAILAGGGILLILSDVLPPLRPSAPWVRIVLLVGPLVFLAAALGPLLAGAGLLEYPPGWAGLLILGVESALTFSIALMLTSFFPASAGGRGKPG
jgi:multisubunit Na+/H+ antiporter MnhB subunit